MIESYNGANLYFVEHLEWKFTFNAHMRMKRSAILNRL